MDERSPWVDDPKIFEEYFWREVDSWFSADIACCDYCYDEFVSLWPYAYSADDCAFQKNGIPLDAFYSGSRLSATYTEEEFHSHVRKICCPRCGEKLEHNIWAYDLPFDVIDGFENTVQELADLAATTPFLLLEHSFCKDVLSAIRSLTDTCSPSSIQHSLFRARSLEHGDVKDDIESFDFPPKHLIGEGRYNHAGNPALYLASDAETCIAELRGASCSICEFYLHEDIRILDLFDPYDSHERKSDLLNSLVYSALVSAKQQDQGLHKPHYVVSRFVADCARNAGFDAIKYPSTQMTDNNFNLVIVSPHVSLKKYSKVVGYHRHYSE